MGMFDYLVCNYPRPAELEALAVTLGRKLTEAEVRRTHRELRAALVEQSDRVVEEALERARRERQERWNQVWRTGS